MYTTEAAKRSSEPRMMVTHVVTYLGPFDLIIDSLYKTGSYDQDDAFCFCAVRVTLFAPADRTLCGLEAAGVLDVRH
jgi:hypothetical protein